MYSEMVSEVIGRKIERKEKDIESISNEIRSPSLSTCSPHFREWTSSNFIAGHGALFRRRRTNLSDNDVVFAPARYSYNEEKKYS